MCCLFFFRIKSEFSMQKLCPAHLTLKLSFRKMFVSSFHSISLFLSTSLSCVCRKSISSCLQNQRRRFQFRLLRDTSARTLLIYLTLFRITTLIINVNIITVILNLVRSRSVTGKTILPFL